MVGGRPGAEAGSARAGPARRAPRTGERGANAAPARRGGEAGGRQAGFEERLGDAARAFERGRYEEARRILRPLVERERGSEPVRELYGLALYRLGRWKEAARELEAFRALSGSVEQHPVLADCRRALGQHAAVWDLWEELRAASPSAELVAEGRIVAAGSLADRGRLEEAIRLLGAAKLPTSRPRAHHLRLAYALADLHERAGDVPRARQLFEFVVRHDPAMADAAARLANL